MRRGTRVPVQPKGTDAPLARHVDQRPRPVRPRWRLRVPPVTVPADDGRESAGLSSGRKAGDETKHPLKGDYEPGSKGDTDPAELIDDAQETAS